MLPSSGMWLGAPTLMDSWKREYPISETLCSKALDAGKGAKS